MDFDLSSSQDIVNDYAFSHDATDDDVIHVFQTNIPSTSWTKYKELFTSNTLVEFIELAMKIFPNQTQRKLTSVSSNKPYQLRRQVACWPYDEELYRIYTHIESEQDRTIAKQLLS